MFWGLAFGTAYADYNSMAEVGQLTLSIDLDTSKLTAGLAKAQSQISSIGAVATKATSEALASLDGAKKATESFGEVAQKALTAVPKAWQGAAKTISKVWKTTMDSISKTKVGSNISKSFSTVVTTVTNAFSKVSTTVTNALNGVKGAINGVVAKANSISPVLGAVASAAVTAGKGVGKAFSTPFSLAKSAAIAFKDAAMNALNNVGEIASNVGKTALQAVQSIITGIGHLAAEGVEALAKFTASSVSSYAEYEQISEGTELVFEDSADTLMNYANNAYQTAQVSASDYLEQVNKFGARLIQATGGDTAKAAELANTAIVDMADNANAFGTSLESVQNAYQGFAKANYTMLDNLNLGYGGTKEEMERLISDANKLAIAQGKAGDMTVDSYADIVEAIHLVQEEMGMTGTAAHESTATIQGSISSLKAAYENFTTGLANPDANIGQLISDMVGQAATAVRNIVPAINEIMTNIAAEMPNLMSSIMSSLANVLSGDNLTTLLNNIGNALTAILTSLATQLPTILTNIITSITTFLSSQGFNDLVTSVVTLLSNLLVTIITQLPILLQTLLDALIVNLPTILNGITQVFFAIVETLPQLLNMLVNKLPELITGIIDGLLSADNLGRLLDACIELFQSFIRAVPIVINSLIQALPQIIGKLVEAIPTLAPKILVGVLKLMASLFISIANLLISGLNSLISAVTLGLVTNAIPTIQAGTVSGWFQAAEGGYASSATPVIFGEAGKEVVLPLENNTDNWSGLLADTLLDEMGEQGGTGSGEIVVNMTNYINSDLDADEIGRKLMTSIRRYT